MLLFGDNNSDGNIATLFGAGFLPIMTLLFLSVLTMWIAYATVPSFSLLLPPGGSIPFAVQHPGVFEFMFTRAVNRRMFFRGRTAALFIVVLTPFFLNVLASPLAPGISFSPWIPRPPKPSGGMGST